MKKAAMRVLAGCIAAAVIVSFGILAWAASTAPTISPADALQMLLDGNGRFVDGKKQYPNQDAARRQDIAGGQHPFACVLSCSDSRIPPELIFDRGLGDLFVVRVAGNVPEPAGMESLKYAVDHLGPRLIIVLGHRNCGAVKAAVSGHTEEFPVIDRSILPAVIKTKGMPGDATENATLENVRIGVQQLSKWAPFATLIAEGKLKIVGGIYNLHTGKVALLDQPGAPPIEEEQGAEDY
jgi:carbonic anhydrase